MFLGLQHNIIPDPQRNNKKCDDVSRAFILRGVEALEKKCKDACEENSKCVTFSGIWNNWCIGCDFELTQDHKGAIAYKKRGTQIPPRSKL